MNKNVNNLNAPRTFNILERNNWSLFLQDKR